MTAVIGSETGTRDAWAVNVPCTRRAVVLVAGLAILSLQLVRAEHIHPAGIEGRTQALVHSHALGDAAADGARVRAGHGDHLLAIFLVPIYESVLRSSLQGASSNQALPDGPCEPDPQFHAISVVQQPVDRHPPGVVAFASPGRAPPLA